VPADDTVRAKLEKLVDMGNVAERIGGHGSIKPKKTASARFDLTGRCQQEVKFGPSGLSSLKIMINVIEY
jgi:hypothetical protein